MRALITEDEPEMARLLEQALVEEGFDVEVAATGERAIDLLAASVFDLVLLDVMLPGLDGFATCRRMRERGAAVPVLMLTARDDIEDRVQGLDSGADDYLGKPFSLDELLARVRALLRRGTADPSARVAVGDLTVDTDVIAAWRGGVRIDLTPRECAILALLMREHGRVVSRDRILARAWPDEPDHNSNVLEVLIRRIREKLDRPFGTESIQTVRGVGYRLELK
jgi:two-component system OmpR family response regulator